jgi:hypothetical protein
MTGMSQGFPDPHWGREDSPPVVKPVYARTDRELRLFALTRR